MAIYRDARGGGLILDRTIGGRRFKRALHVPDTATGRARAAQYNGMLDTLRHTRPDLLERLRTGELDFATTWLAVHRGTPDSLEYGDRLADVVASWLPTATRPNGQAIGDAHRRSLAVSFRKLTTPTATVADLPVLLRRYREQCQAEDTPRAFNKARAAAQALVRERYGKRRSDLYRTVGDVPVLACRNAPGLRLTLDEARQVYAHLPAPYAAIWWTSVWTGMRPKELWGPWDVRDHGVWIAGTKTAAAVRVVPWVVAEPPTRGYDAYRKHLANVRPGLTPYTARRLYAHLLEAAGIPRTRRRQYLGHRAQDVSDRYETVELGAYLATDAAALRALWETPRRPRGRAAARSSR